MGNREGGRRRYRERVGEEVGGGIIISILFSDKVYKRMKNERGIVAAWPTWSPTPDELSKKYNLKTDRLKALVYLFHRSWLAARSDRSYYCWFFVSSRQMQAFATKWYKKYLDVLIEEGIVVMNTNAAGRASYLAGARPTSFSWVNNGCILLDPEFSPCVIIDHTTCKSISKDIERRKDRIICPKTIPESQRLVLNTMREYVLKTYIPEGLTDAASVQRDHYFKIDDFGERFHHLLTSQDKGLRRHWRFEGHPTEKLVEIDLQNSQPYFLMQSASLEYTQRFLPEFRVAGELAELYNTKADFREFSELCNTGGIYKDLMAGIGVDPQDKEMRGTFKTALFRHVFYGPYRGDKMPKEEIGASLVEMMMSKFPSVYRYINDVKLLRHYQLPGVKSLFYDVTETGKSYYCSHKSLSCMMQRAESRMVLGHVAPALIKAGIQFITIHDSFLVLSSRYEEAQHIVRHTFEGLGLVPPSIKSKL